jgi:hypothetical protein
LKGSDPEKVGDFIFIISIVALTPMEVSKISTEVFIHRIKKLLPYMHDVNSRPSTMTNIEVTFLTNLQTYVQTYIYI